MNILFVVGAILLLGSFVADYIVINGFISHPTSSVAASGETIPYKVKGKTVYITATQRSETVAITVGEIAGFAILLVYSLMAKRRR
jgi:hypothetical protein